MTLRDMTWEGRLVLEEFFYMGQVIELPGVCSCIFSVAQNDKKGLI